MHSILIFLNSGQDFGGSTKSFLDLLPILTSKYKIFIVAPNLQEAFNEKCIAAGVEAKNLYSRTNSYPGSVTIHNNYSLKNILRRIIYPIRINCELRKIHSYFNCDFDLIYSNSLAVQIGCEYAKYYKIPHVWHVREFMNEDHGIEFLMRKRTYNKLFAYSNAIFITNAISDKFNKFFKEKTIILHDFVKFNLVEKKLADKFIFAIIGSVSESKGQRYAIEAFNYVVKQYSNCKLLIVGQGNDMDYCRDMVTKYSIEDKVEFLGQRNDVNKILSNANVLLVCSRFEALGRVTIEGMLSKTLVIGANTAGTKELIGDSYGFLYKQGDIMDLCKKMIYSIEHQSECQEIVKRAYNNAIQDFTYSNYENKLIAFFESILI